MALPTPPEPPTLDNRVQALPQELQDSILDLTIGIHDSFCTMAIDGKYKSPLGLQISRATRAKFANHYYGGGYIFHTGVFQTRVAK